MTPEILGRVERLLGRRVTGTRAVVGGFTQASRGVVVLDGGDTVFVKAATDALTAEWLRAELRIYESSVGASAVLPRLLAAERDPPLVVLQDLSAGERPPPWEPRHVAAVRATLDALHELPVPEGLPLLTDHGLLLRGWRRVLEDPDPVHALGLCSAESLNAALPALVDAEAAFPLEGDGLLHMDVRSDNLAVLGDRAVLFDWNWSCRGNPVMDTAFWLPSLALESGPSPWEVLPDQPAAAAVVSGFFAWSAAQPIGPDGPPLAVRAFQRRQASVALPWAARALGLTLR